MGNSFVFFYPIISAGVNRIMQICGFDEIEEGYEHK